MLSLKSFKNINFKLGLISTLFTLAVLVVIPSVRININNSLLQLDTYIGGYYINLFDKYVLDLRDFKKGLDLEGGIKSHVGQYVGY